VGDKLVVAAACPWPAALAVVAAVRVAVPARIATPSTWGVSVVEIDSTPCWAACIRPLIEELDAVIAEGTEDATHDPLTLDVLDEDVVLKHVNASDAFCCCNENMHCEFEATSTEVKRLLVF
jgi:hypothetical protein